MYFSILNTALSDSTLASKCALTVMAKAPRAGRVKTRLAPTLTLEQAADLNICFLRDTAENIGQVAQSGRAAGIICYTPIGDEGLFDGILPQNFALLPQRGEGFGERLLAAAEDILACGFGAVCLIDSDSPTVPAAAFEKAVDELARPGDRIVLGPSNDGGYYLIGMKKAHPEPFARIRWSTSVVYAETMAASATAGLEVNELPMWYDVDDEKTLDLLRSELLCNAAPRFTTLPGYAAPHSSRFLRALRARDAGR